MLLPFTPFHWGPASIGLLFKRHVHLPTFLVANMILDIEPLVVLVWGLHYPLHGYAHTFLGAVLVGVGLACVMRLLNKPLHGLLDSLALLPREPLEFNGFVLAGVGGTVVHVLLDAPLYPEMRPFYPCSSNPLYHPALTFHIYAFCGITMVVGFIGYLLMLAHTLTGSMASP